MNLQGMMQSLRKKKKRSTAPQNTDNAWYHLCNIFICLDNVVDQTQAQCMLRKAKTELHCWLLSILDKGEQISDC